MRVLLTAAVSWAAISFIFTWLWGTAISCEPAEYEYPTDPGQPTA